MIAGKVRFFESEVVWAQSLRMRLGGQIQVAFGDQVKLMPPMATGKLRALAVSSPKRSADSPDVPTVAETLPGFEAIAWQRVVACAG